MSNNQKSKYQPPKELSEDNITPLDIDLLGDYMDQVAEAYVGISDFRKGSKDPNLLIQAGTHAIPVPLRQTIHDEIDIINARQRGAEEMLKIVRATLKLARKTVLKRPEGKRLLRDGISLKTVEAMKYKAGKDYENDISRVVDPVRCTLLAGNSHQLQLLSEIFRPCAQGLLMPDANFEVVRYRNDFNRMNPEKGGIRRLHINVKMPDADGLVGEIFVFYGPSAAKYDISREAYGEERSSKDAMTRAVMHGQYDHRTHKKTRQKATKASQRRRQANNEAADFPEVRALTMHQRAYIVEEFPVIVNDDAHQGKRFAIVPNPATGLWETDQRFLDVIDNPDQYPEYRIVNTDSHDALIRGEALCRHEELSEALKADMH